MMLIRSLIVEQFNASRFKLTLACDNQTVTKLHPKSPEEKFQPILSKVDLIGRYMGMRSKKKKGGHRGPALWRGKVFL